MTNSTFCLAQPNLVSLSAGVSKSRKMDLLGAADSLWDRSWRAVSTGVEAIYCRGEHITVELCPFKCFSPNFNVFIRNVYNACSKINSCLRINVRMFSIYACCLVMFSVLDPRTCFLLELLGGTIHEPSAQIIVWLHKCRSGVSSSLLIPPIRIKRKQGKLRVFSCEKSYPFVAKIVTVKYFLVKRKREQTMEVSSGKGVF